MTGLPKLKVRRQAKADKFALKCTQGRFSHWFPTNLTTRRGRNTNKFMEFNAKTSRLYNSPLFAMRRQCIRLRGPADLLLINFITLLQGLGDTWPQDEPTKHPGGHATRLKTTLTTNCPRKMDDPRARDSTQQCCT